MRPSYSQQYSPGHGYANNPGMARYEGPQGYPQANSQQGQQNPNYYAVQQVPQMGFNPQLQQNMGAQNMGTSYTQPGQVHPMQQPQGQNLQAQQYNYPAMQSGPQSDTMGGANSPGQVAQGGPVGDPRFGGGPGGNDR